jgi:peptidoglycan/xylan/chitin deacetylase (PgdA/CDA1 family)
MAWDRQAREYEISTDQIISSDNAQNIIPAFDHDESVDNNITWSAKNGVVTVSGTASGTFFTVIAGSSTKLPKGLSVGDDIFLWLNGPDGLRLSIYTWPGGANVFETSGVGKFTIPAGIVGLQIRLRVPNGQVIPAGTIVHPYVGKSLPNFALEKIYGFKAKKPMLTIIDDDGHQGFYTYLKPIIAEKKVPIATAIVTERPDNPSEHASMTWEQIVECARDGAEILSHSHTHLTGDVAETTTENEIWLNYQRSKNVLVSHGLDPHGILVFAGNSGNNEKCQNAAMRSFDYAFHSAGNVVIRQDNFKPYYIQRFGLGIGEFIPASGETIASTPKTYIDLAISENGWVVFMVHTSSGDWTNTAAVNGIKAVIDYALANGVEIVTAEYGIKQFVQI